MPRTAALAAAAVAAFALTASLAAAGSSRSRVSGPFIGYYEAHLTAAQAEARGDSRLAGRFILVLSPNGLYVTFNSFDGASVGRFAVLPGQRLRFFDDVGCSEIGPARPGGGTYRWSLNGNRLRLTLVKEGPCSGRTQTLTYPVWTSQ
jgi:hypothetical protein